MPRPARHQIERGGSAKPAGADHNHIRPLNQRSRSGCRHRAHYRHHERPTRATSAAPAVRERPCRPRPERHPRRVSGSHQERASVADTVAHRHIPNPGEDRHGGRTAPWSPQRPPSAGSRFAHPRTKSSSAIAAAFAGRRAPVFVDGEVSASLSRATIARPAFGDRAGKRRRRSESWFRSRAILLPSGEPARNAGRDDYREEPSCPNPSC